MRSLRKKSDFSKVFQEGVKRVGRCLVLYLLSAEDDAQGVIASRKLGGAVKRNRAKRLLREVLSERGIGGPGDRARIFARFFPTAADTRDSQEQARSLWVVGIARPPILAAKSRDVIDEARRLLLLD